MGAIKEKRDKRKSSEILILKYKISKIKNSKNDCNGEIQVEK